jgi:hypothetical protein
VSALQVTSVSPEYDVVLVWVISALEEVEEEMASFDVDITRICAEGKEWII